MGDIRGLVLEVEGPPAASPGGPSLTGKALVKCVSKCDVADIVLQHRCGRLSITGAGCIFHLNPFYPDFFENAQAAAGPLLRPSCLTGPPVCIAPTARHHFPG